MARGLAAWCALAAVLELGACRCGQLECNLFFSWLATPIAHAHADDHGAEDSRPCPGESPGHVYQYDPVVYLSQAPVEVPPVGSAAGFLASQDVPFSVAAGPCAASLLLPCRLNPIPRLPLRAELSRL